MGTKLHVLSQYGYSMYCVDFVLFILVQSLKMMMCIGLIHVLLYVLRFLHIGSGYILSQIHLRRLYTA